MYIFVDNPAMNNLHRFCGNDACYFEWSDKIYAPFNFWIFDVGDDSSFKLSKWFKNCKWYTKHKISMLDMSFR